MQLIRYGANNTELRTINYDASNSILYVFTCIDTCEYIMNNNHIYYHHLFFYIHTVFKYSGF